MEYSVYIIYAEVLNDSYCVFFDFKPLGKDNFIYYLDIPDVYKVDENIFKKARRELDDLFVDLHKKFSEINPEPWTNLTMYLESSGKFNIDYNYDEVTLTPNEVRILWKYRIFGIYPQKERYKK